MCHTRYLAIKWSIWTDGRVFEAGLPQRDDFSFRVVGNPRGAVDARVGTVRGALGGEVDLL
jgi:hypothetical protein